MTGSLAFDVIMDFPGNFADHIQKDKLHVLSVSFLVDTLKKQRGGTAGNIAYNLALLRVPCSILGVVGEDFEAYQQFLNTQGVDTSAIKIIEGAQSATVMVITDKKDNQISAFYPGAMRFTDSISILNLPSKPDFSVISPNLPQAMAKLVKECQIWAIPYLYDPGMQLPRLSDKELKLGLEGAKVLIGNDYELGMIRKRLKLSDDDLVKQVEVLITTLGEKGSVIQTKETKLEIPAAKAFKVVDPTGAGDAFRAGFLAGFLSQKGLSVCGKMGSTAAVYSVEKYGTTTHEFTIEEFKLRYQENFKEDLNL